MSDIFAVRDVDEKTRRFIYSYARNRRIKVGGALKEIAFLADEHLKESERSGHKPKYKTIFDSYGKIRFKSGKALSERLDEELYGE